MSPDRKECIIASLKSLSHMERRALSSRFPVLSPAVVFMRSAVRGLRNLTDRRLRTFRPDGYYPSVVARHQSVLRRRLGDSDPLLQERKIVNLRRAIARLDGLAVRPGETFSFWQAVGRPSYRDGYVDGMLLSDGLVVEGLGGGLCQLSNFLFWILLHAPTEIVERHHHSVDAFPDSGRTLPFGSGATVFCNYIDLKVRNTGPGPLQLRLWLTDTHLKGQVLSPEPIADKFRLEERQHCFIRHDGQHYRYNEIYRRYRHGVAEGEELIVRNFAPVRYPVDEGKLRREGVEVVEDKRK